MAINWPTIAQGAGTGTTYTAPTPNYNTWTWNGYAWTSKSTIPRGGFGGPWVIFDQYGKARAFSTLQSALNYASSGDTINLFQNIREIITTNYHVRITKDISINLNGFEYILDAQSNLDLTGYAISNALTFDELSEVSSVAEVDIKIYNGKVSLINVLNSGEIGQPEPLILIGEPVETPTVYSNMNFGSNWFFNDVVFESCAIEQYVGKFRSNVTGGIFYSNEITKSTHGGVGVGLLAVNKSPNKLMTIFRNVTGISESGNGIIHFHNDIQGSRTFLIGCKGETRKNKNNYPARGILSPNQENFGTIMYNCTGINIKPVDVYIEGGSIISGIFIGRQVKAIKCTGNSDNTFGVGIETNSSTLIHCIGKSYIGFKSYSGTQFKLCSNGYAPLMTTGIEVSADSQGATFINGDSIENCSIEGNNSAISRSGYPSTAGHFINVFNSVLKGGYSGIELSLLSQTQLRAANNVIYPNEDSPIGQVNSIVIGGTSGTIIANNILKGRGGSISNGSYAVRADGLGATSTFYIAGNTCINYDSIFKPGLSYISQGMTATSNNYGSVEQRYYITQNR